MSKLRSLPWTNCFIGKKCPCGSSDYSVKCCWQGLGRWKKRPVGIIKVKKSSYQNPSCYLSSKGNCSAKVTKEHFISENILKQITDSTLNFENAAYFFGGKDVREIGISRFSAKILCDHHNSALSNLDIAAGVTFSNIEKLSTDIINMEKGERVKSFYISSGLDMERWLVKVYLGLVAAGKIKSKSGLTIELNSLHHSLLDYLLGINSLLSPLGLYLHVFAGQKKYPGKISFGTIKLIDEPDEVGGLLLSLGVMNFVLVTSPHYGGKFSDPNWFWHQTLAWNIKRAGSKISYLFSY